jgi:prophage regulatory protein
MPRYLRFADLKAAKIIDNRMTLSRWIKNNGFPRPVKLGPNTVAWPEDEVQAWLESRRAKSAA